MDLKQKIKNQAQRQGFLLTGITSPEPPQHLSTFEQWLNSGYHGSMGYLATDQARTRRADPRKILPECKSILVLGTPYSNPKSAEATERNSPTGRVASYAWGDDYHKILNAKLKELVAFIEAQVGHAVPNRYYTDTGPILERDLAQRAGLGWIGKNTCLINPKEGSYFFLAEILLGIDLEPDVPVTTDHCGTCTRCIEACPTDCILPNRTIDAQRCISYLTIELKDDIPEDIRPLIGDWVFGCDICQSVCPWNRFSDQEVDDAFTPRVDVPHPNLIHELEILPESFSRKFKNSPVKRAKRRGYLRNVIVAMGNSQNTSVIPALEKAKDDEEPMLNEHIAWAIDNIKKTRYEE
ncbi:MAG: tRNA epoxyqueuosine(34) reductase QueG [Anaerolineae bacterium]|nr:tRNA epoxyqueuosine(34) reductase QueG [Anaerolineae bacterium]